MFWRFSLLTVLIVGGLSACHQETDTTPATQLIASYKALGAACETVCSYDDQSRLVKAMVCDSAELYSYFNDSIVMQYTVSGVERYRYTYLFDAAKKYVSGYVRRDAFSTSTYRYQYDANGFRTALTLDGDTATYRHYQISDGNVVEEVAQYTANPSGNATITASYYANTRNLLGNDNYGRPFLGTSSKNLKQGETWVTPDGTFFILYKYEIDDQSRVHKRVKILNAVDTMEVRYFVYR
ncbi:MAG: hypothetical protein U0T84_11930 [Chitinophagales bacterium]